MDDDKPICLKHFGFLPKKEQDSSQKKHSVDHKKLARYYVKDTSGIYLTTRETEASYLISRGFTIREAAEQMGLSARTVEFYLNNVRRKLGAKNKNELIRILYENEFFKQLS